MKLHGQNVTDLVSQLRAILTRKINPNVRVQEALRVLEEVATGDASQKRGLSSTASSTAPSVVRTESESLAKRQNIATKGGGRSSNLIGESFVMHAIYDAIERVGSSQATVLIRGESGTGKELVAKAIHTSSLRKNGPFIPVHCAAVPGSLIESTLFGHERGAFTGAITARKGKLEQASKGTLFLDEVGDIPLDTQVKLLRVIQEREYERIGGLGPLEVDVRIVAATHRDLESMVFSGTFREDLYYRLNVVPLVLPPLRERKEDIALLIEHFLDRFNRENHRRIKLDSTVIDMLTSFHWPGNIRELHNCIERIVVLADSSTVTLSSIPKSLQSYIGHIREVTFPLQKRDVVRSVATLPKDVRNLERERLVEVLYDVGWIKAKAARKLGLTPRQVAYKMRKYQIRAPSAFS